MINILMHRIPLSVQVWNSYLSLLCQATIRSFPGPINWSSNRHFLQLRYLFSQSPQRQQQFHPPRLKTPLQLKHSSCSLRTNISNITNRKFLFMFVGNSSWKSIKRIPINHHQHLCRIPSAGFSMLPWKPTAPVKLQTKTAHGRVWTDEYAWMEEGLSEEVNQYIDIENKFCEDYFQDLRRLRRSLEKEVLHWEDAQTDLQADVKVIGDYAYYPRILDDGSRQYCRRNITTGEDQTLFNLDHFAESHGYEDVSVVAFKLSPCQSYLGVVVESSSGMYDGHIIAMETQGSSRHVECISGIFNLEFLGSDCVLYTRHLNLQAREVWRHQIKTSQAKDELVYEEKDERFFVDLSHSEDGQLVMINSNSRSVSEVWVVGCTDAPPTMVWSRQRGVECYLDHCQGVLLALTNWGPNGELRLLKSSLQEAWGGEGVAAWQEVFAPPPGSVIQDMDVFESQCVIALLVKITPELAVIPYHSDDKAPPIHIQVPTGYTTLTPSLNAEIYSSDFQFVLSSPTHPPRSFQLDFKTGIISSHGDDENEVIYPDERHDSVQPDNFMCRRLLAKSKDGTCIPITVFHKDSVMLDEERPLLVIVYGAYGKNVQMDYQPERMALLSRGWVLAFCHVRGGGELGKKWYSSGRLDCKHHTFEDFECCIEHLHTQGISRPSLTAGWGASAGALPLAVLSNERPDLIKAAVMRMPFVDVQSSMLDSSSPLTPADTLEWGDPSSAASLEYIAAYCPYHNLKSQDYPSLLMTSSCSDQQVPVWGPLKHMARLRALAQAGAQGNGSRDPSFLMRVYQDGGHSGPEGDDGVDQATMEWSFLYKELGLDTQG